MRTESLFKVTAVDSKGKYVYIIVSTDEESAINRIKDGVSFDDNLIIGAERLDKVDGYYINLIKKG